MRVGAAVLVPLLMAASQSPGGIQRELARLGVRTALVLPSSAIDDFPIWSPDSHYVAANVMGTWHKVDLANITLVAAKWHGDERIAVVEKKSSVTPLEPALLKQWKPEHEPENAVAENAAVRVELRGTDLSTALILTRRGHAPQEIWKTDLEECGAPVLSPDGRLVAFLCLTNGLFVMDVRW